MSVFLNRPRTKKVTRYLEEPTSKLICANSSMQGWRQTQEDSHVVELRVEGCGDHSQPVAFLGVYDGHGGDSAAREAKEKLLQKIKETDAWAHIWNEEDGSLLRSSRASGNDKEAHHETTKRVSSNGVTSGQGEGTKGRIKKSVKQEDESHSNGKKGSNGTGGALLSKSRTIQKQLSSGDAKEGRTGKGQPQKKTLTALALAGRIGQACAEGFLAFDSALRELPDFKLGQNYSGATACVCFITHEHLIIANCGDSRAVLCTGGKSRDLSRDHKPSNEEERRRIEAAGGKVIKNRVNGRHAVSRSFGDFMYKRQADRSPEDQMVTAQPDVYVVKRSWRDELLCIACDGVWDVMSGQEIADMLHDLLSKKALQSMQQCCETILDRCLERGSKDNMTVILVAFPRFQKLMRGEGCCAIT